MTFEDGKLLQVQKRDGKEATKEGSQRKQTHTGQYRVCVCAQVSMNELEWS